MTFAIIRGSNGRRHEVDFEDDPITIEVGISDAVVEIIVEAPEDLAPPQKRRYAMLSVPRGELMAALGVEMSQKRARGKALRPRLVPKDNSYGSRR